MNRPLDGRAIAGPVHLDCDVVIVGSGAGGATAARILAEAGLDVVVLEEGGRVTPREHSGMRPSQSVRHLWREAGLSIAIPLGASPVINIMMGRCMGGSSALTGGVCFRAPESVTAEWVDTHGLAGLSSRDLEPYFEEVEKNLHVETVPPTMRSRSTRLFAEGARRMGFELEPMRRNTRACVGRSTCNFGCPEGAKMGVDESYLPAAQRAGARLFADCRVDRVRIERERAVGVEGRVLNGRNGSAGSSLRVRARRVVLSAGAIHTPLILQRTGLDRARHHLGKHLTLHPAFRVMARFAERVEGWRGALQSAFSRHFAGDGIQLNSVFVPPGVVAGAQPGVGSTHRMRAAQLPNIAMFGVNLHDAGGGTVRRGIGREPFVTYRMAREDRAAMAHGLEVAARTFAAAGAEEVILPVAGLEPLPRATVHRFDFGALGPRHLECTSQHPLGTCRIGRDAARGVVSLDHETWEVRELFVLDGSVVPTSLGVNPQLTIMALATRAAERILNRRSQSRTV